MTSETKREPQRAIRFGFMVPPLAEQLHGTGIDHGTIMHFQKDADAVLRAHLRELITDKMRDAAFRKLVRHISRAALTAADESAER